ncbi:MAG: two-component sensor histidine kinase [Desulfovibrio sp.]|jgi:two-component system NtrC family sensor kinase|nr:two-component sensor histidine kinase [Desulfovibrio sp.]
MAGSAQPKKYQNLRKAIVATTLCFAILPMLAVGIIIPIQFTELYHEKTVREVENVARGKGRTIDIFFEERTSQLRSLADMFSFEELTAPGKLASVLRAVKANSQSYVDLGVIDMEGVHVAYAGSYDVRDANYKNEPWFTEVKRKGVFVSDVFLGFRKFPHIIIAVMREEGDRSWILRATIDSQVFTSIVQSSRLSQEGDAFVVSRDGLLQTESHLAGHVMEKVDVSWPRQGGISEGFLHGKRMLLAKAPLDNAPWMLVVAEDPSEHLSLLSKAQTMAVVVILLGLAALSAGAWMVTRFMINRLIQADKEKASYDATLLQSSKMAALGKLAAGIAHEINNPLMLIREHAGWIRDLLEDEKPDKMQHHAEMRNAAMKVEQNVDRAKDITHRLLGFARRIDPSSESLPVNPIVDQAIAFLQNEANFRGISIERDFIETDLRVATDVGQLQQVILNILDNAIDAVGKGGRVLVSTRRNDADGTAQVILHDNGTGIPPERLEQIFDPFFTTKTVGEGTGLGLSICYSIMESLGGSIRARNHPEGGAEFTISLPVSGRQ